MFASGERLAGREGQVLPRALHIHDPQLPPEVVPGCRAGEERVRHARGQFVTDRVSLFRRVSGSGALLFIGTRFKGYWASWGGCCQAPSLPANRQVDRLLDICPGLTVRQLLEKFSRRQRMDAHFPTTDGWERVFRRYAQPDPDRQPLLAQRNRQLPT